MPNMSGSSLISTPVSSFFLFEASIVVGGRGGLGGVSTTLVCSPDSTLATDFAIKSIKRDEGGGTCKSFTADLLLLALL